MTTSTTSHCKPSIFRYLMIMLYDSLLLLSVLLLASVVAVAFNEGDAIRSNSPFFLIYLLFVSGFFYSWFWTHGGQTLGLRAWKVQLTSDDHHHVTWNQAILRFIMAIISWVPLGLGFWWQWIDKANRSWPDIVSNTQLHYQQDHKPKPLSRLS
ncbi:MAG: hypothetical protein COB23_03990 [Methylophaga sp.]|nr:MAG: hypothetical protein COB23_03990 [Methylophaga sp.]